MSDCANDASCVIYDRVSGFRGRAHRCVICDACVDVAARDIGALVHDYRDLAQALARWPGNGIERQRAGGERGAPLRLDVDELMRKIVWQLGVWEPAVREAARLAPERTARVRPGFAVSVAVSVIAPRVDVLANVGLTWCLADGPTSEPVCESGLDGIGRLRALHRRSRRLLGTSAQRTRLPGVCGGCGAQALIRESGADVVACSACGCAWSSVEYERYVGMCVGSLAALSGSLSDF